MNSLRTPAIEKALRRLHEEASSDGPRIALGFAKSMGLGLRPHHMKDAYIAVTRGQGQLLYALARASKAKRLVEFGASFGISAIYLGAAARDNGGRLVTTEIERNKIEAARANLSSAGLDDVAELRAGDAMETLAHDEGAIDFLFLDGWNDLYVPLMNLLGPRLSDGALVVVDNASFPGVKAFLERFRALTGFVSSRIESDKGAMEVACFVGPWESIA